MSSQLFARQRQRWCMLSRTVAVAGTAFLSMKSSINVILDAPPFEDFGILVGRSNIVKQYLRRQARIQLRELDISCVIQSKPTLKQVPIALSPSLRYVKYCLKEFTKPLEELERRHCGGAHCWRQPVGLVSARGSPTVPHQRSRNQRTEVTPQRDGNMTGDLS